MAERRSAPESIPYERLSSESLELIRAVALPHALGYSHAELGERLGWSKARMAYQMRLLRQEILAAVEEDSS
jgi:hypothetical protein